MEQLERSVCVCNCRGLLLCCTCTIAVLWPLDGTIGWTSRYVVEVLWPSRPHSERQRKLRSGEDRAEGP